MHQYQGNLTYLLTVCEVILLSKTSQLDLSITQGSCVNVESSNVWLPGGSEESGSTVMIKARKTP